MIESPKPPARFALNASSLHVLMLTDGAKTVDEICNQIHKETGDALGTGLRSELIECFDRMQRDGLVFFSPVPHEATPVVRVRFSEFPAGFLIQENYFTDCMTDRMLVMVCDEGECEIRFCYRDSHQPSNQCDLDPNAITVLVTAFALVEDFQKFDYVFSVDAEKTGDPRRWTQLSDLNLASRLYGRERLMVSNAFHSFLFPIDQKKFQFEIRNKVCKIVNTGNIASKANRTTTCESMEKCHIFLSTDKNQRPGLFALIRSIVCNTKNIERLHFHLIVDSDKESYVGVFERCFDAALQYDIMEFSKSNQVKEAREFLKSNIRVDGGEKESRRIHNLMNYARFYLPGIFTGIDRGLHLDVDMIVNTDIVRLFDEDISADIIASPLNRSLDLYHADLNLTEKGFNAGVLLINFDLWRRCRITSDLEFVMKEHRTRRLFRGGTQPILNVVFNGECKHLDPRWNVTDLGFREDIDKTELGEAWILHWNGTHKPWLESGLYKHLWQPYQVS